MAEALVHPRTGLPQNISGRPYNSMNRLMLYMEMDRMGYTLPVFMTFRQLKDENLMIIKGSHALPVTFYDITVKHKTTGEKSASMITKASRNFRSRNIR